MNVGNIHRNLGRFYVDRLSGERRKWNRKGREFT